MIKSNLKPILYLYENGAILVQNGEAIASHPNGGEACRATTFGRVRIGGRGVGCVLRHEVQLVRVVVGIGVDSRGQQHRVFGRIVGHAVVGRFAAASVPQRHQRDVFGRGEVEAAQTLLFHVEQKVAVDGVSRSFALQLEYDHAVVVTGREQAERGMSRDHPVAVVLATKCVQACSGV